MQSHLRRTLVAVSTAILFAAAISQVPWQAKGDQSDNDNPHIGPPRETPRPGLTRQDIQTILDHAEAKANSTPSGLRSVGGVVQKTRMHIAIVDRDGTLLAVRSMSDAWVGSYDIAVAKSRTATFFSSDQNALTSRVIGELSQPGQPLWQIGDSNQIGVSGGPNTRNGLICFPGGVPLYKNGRLVGGIGVSGDGVDQDEVVALGGMAGYEPPSNIGKVGL